MKSITSNISIKIISTLGIIYKINIKNIDICIYELKEMISERICIPNNVFELVYNGRILNEKNNLRHYGIEDNSILHCIENNNGGEPYFSKEINIKFFKDPKDIYKSYFSFFYENQSDEKLYVLLRHCFLKEISLKINENQVEGLPESISYIFEILKYAYITIYPKEDMKKILEKIKYSNILNFSNFIDKTINSSHLKTILHFLDKDDYKIINDIKKCLLNYNEYISLFKKDINERKRKSIFEFSIISMVIMEKEKCENRVDKYIISWNKY